MRLLLPLFEITEWDTVIVGPFVMCKFVSNDPGDQKLTQEIPENPYEQADLDIRILRYMSFLKLVSLLELKALWFSRLGVLEDQFEGMLPKATRAKMIEKSKNWFETFPQPELRKQLLEMTDRNVQDGRCVLVVNCWCLGNYESPDMWKSYVRDRYGVVIRSTVARLRRSLWGNPDMLHIGKVQYIDFESHDMSTYDGGQAHKRALIKRREFAYENELRVSTLNNVTMSCLNPDGSEMSEEQKKGPGRFDPERLGLYVKVELDRLIEAIFVAPNSPGWFLHLAKRIVARYGLKVPVYRSHLDMNTA